jgi:hypothetical protein
MNTIKQYLGYVWIAAGLAAAWFNLMVMGFPKLMSGRQDDFVFALINIFLLTPIVSGGLIIFGYYALKGDFDEKN